MAARQPSDACSASWKVSTRAARQLILLCCYGRQAGKLKQPAAGVQSVDVDLPTQKVVVHGSAAPETVLATVKKTGERTALGVLHLICYR